MVLKPESKTPFSALWAGQLISLFGDRVHQVALAFLVLRATDSPVAVGAVFFAASLPNLLLGPIAGILLAAWRTARRHRLEIA